jgi:hypothetical protein
VIKTKRHPVGGNPGEKVKEKRNGKETGGIMTTYYINKDFNADEIKENNFVPQRTSEQYQERMMTNFEKQVYDYIVRHPGSKVEFIAEHFGHTHTAYRAIAFLTMSAYATRDIATGGIYAREV